jgi:hypothetical protein
MQRIRSTTLVFTCYILSFKLRGYTCHFGTLYRSVLVYRRGEGDRQTKEMDVMARYKKRGVRSFVNAIRATVSGGKEKKRRAKQLNRFGLV